MSKLKRVAALTEKEVNNIEQFVYKELGVNPAERKYDVFDIVNYIAKVEKYEKALVQINEYIPTKDFAKDVHNLKTIASNIL